MAGCPKHAARHEVKVAWVCNCCVIVANRCAEDPRLLGSVVVNPRDHEVIRFLGAIILFKHLHALGDRMSAVKHVNVVVMLFVNRSPISQAFGDWRLFVGVVNRDGRLRTMRAGLEAKILKP